MFTCNKVAKDSINNVILHRSQLKAEVNVTDHFTENRVVCVVDSYDSAPFNINEAGFIRNDISQLERASTESERQALLRRLQDFEDSKDPNEGLKISDRLALIRPRSCQSMAELEGYASVLASYDSQKLDAAYREAVKDTKVDNDAPAVSPSVDPAGSSAVSE